MVSINVEQERTRLERVYADMTEGELRSIAGDADSLTAEAASVLSVELSRRGLDIEASTWRPKTKPPSQTEFGTRQGLVMLGIFAGIGVALMLLVLRFPEWFRGCVRTRPWW